MDCWKGIDSIQVCYKFQNIVWTHWQRDIYKAFIYRHTLFTLLTGHTQFIQLFLWWVNKRILCQEQGFVIPTLAGILSDMPYTESPQIRKNTFQGNHRTWWRKSCHRLWLRMSKAQAELLSGDLQSYLNVRMESYANTLGLMNFSASKIWQKTQFIDTDNTQRAKYTVEQS